MSVLAIVVVALVVWCTVSVIVALAIGAMIAHADREADRHRRAVERRAVMPDADITT